MLIIFSTVDKDHWWLTQLFLRMMDFDTSSIVSVKARKADDAHCLLCGVVIVSMPCALSLGPPYHDGLQATAFLRSEPRMITFGIMLMFFSMF